MSPAKKQHIFLTAMFLAFFLYFCSSPHTYGIGRRPKRRRRAKERELEREREKPVESYRALYPTALVRERICAGRGAHVRIGTTTTQKYSTYTQKRKKGQPKTSVIVAPIEAEVTEQGVERPHRHRETRSPAGKAEARNSREPLKGNADKKYGTDSDGGDASLRPYTLAPSFLWLHNKEARVTLTDEVRERAKINKDGRR